MIFKKMPKSGESKKVEVIMKVNNHNQYVYAIVESGAGDVPDKWLFDISGLTHNVSEWMPENVFAIIKNSLVSAAKTFARKQLIDTERTYRPYKAKVSVLSWPPALEEFTVTTEKID